MKFFLFVFLSLPLLGHANPTECKEFVDTVLKPATTYEQNSDDHGRRFVKDEKQALKFILFYDVNRLGIEDAIQTNRKNSTDCKFLAASKGNIHTCDDFQQNFYFLQGLLYGTKKNGWKPLTLEFAKKAVLSYLSWIAHKEDVPLVYLQQSLPLLADLNSQHPESKLSLLKIQALQRDIVTTLEKKPEGENKANCQTYQAIIKKEIEIANTVRPNYAALLQEMKPSHQCERFAEEVLKQAVSKDNLDIGPTFVKDEAKALDFIKRYDINLLNIPELKIETEKLMTDCDYFKQQMNVQTRTLVCQNDFENFDFMTGLVYGMKNHGWKPSTIALGKQTIYNYLNYISENETSIIRLSIGYAILRNLVEKLPEMGPPLEKVQTQNQELEKTTEKLALLESNASLDCNRFQLSKQAQAKEVSLYRLKLASLLKGNSK